MVPRPAPVIFFALIACGDAQTSAIDSITTMAETMSVETTEQLGLSETAFGGDNPTTSTTGGGSSGDGTGPKQDVGVTDWDVPPRCGAVDVVLVIERSPQTHVRMWDTPFEWAAAVETTLPGWSTRYLSVAAGIGPMPLQCEEACQDDGFCWDAPEINCDGKTACDWVSGAGMMRKNSLVQCLAGPQRWLDADKDDVPDLLRCLWHQGVDFGGYQTIRSLLDAVGPELAAGCNEGFLRDDAWLVPVIITHGYPNIAGTPASWATELGAAKHDDRDAIVPVLIYDHNNYIDNPIGCEEGPGDLTEGYQDFVAQFPTHVTGDICKSFTPPLVEALEHIADVCKVEERPE